MSGAPPATILYTAWAPFFSGAERALLILLDALDRSRYRPVVAIGTDGELAAAIRERDIPVVHVPIAYSGVRTLPAWFKSVSALIRMARQEHAVLFHSNDVPSFQPAGYAARWLGRPAVTHVRFPDSMAGFEWFLKPGFAHAIFVSDDLRRSALEHAPSLFEGRSEAVHDGVIVGELPVEEARAAVRQELGLPRDGFVVAMAGQVVEVKGIWEFIDAATLLVKRGVPATFAVLGDDLKGNGATRVRAEQLVAERGLRDRVTFLGFRPNAPRLIPAFDVVAVPSHIEPLGNATLEAMAAGVPVVGSRVGGIPEMIVDGETGALVPSRDAGALADAIETLVRDPARARALGRAGHTRARGAFSPAAHAARVQAIYDRVLGPPSSFERA